MKKETLEEAAERWVFETNGHKWSNNDNTAGDNYGSFIEGAKCQQERSYSEEDMKEAFQVGFNVGYNDETSPSYLTAEKFIEQFKKK